MKRSEQSMLKTTLGALALAFAHPWLALALVVAALFTVLFQPTGRRVTAAPLSLATSSK